YARMIFDRDLHDRLLKEVLDTNPAAPGYTLVNTYAQKQARQLLENAEDYF
ncbi:MAG: TRAP transporter TatT component family protein, partial [Proteobacteria bacterium]|nr:TRAP transporter TatT component family protein [Pseudomonadota bacterium]